MDARLANLGTGMRPRARRLAHIPSEAIARLIEPLGRWAVASRWRPYWRWVPSFPAFCRPMTAPVRVGWPRGRSNVPEGLRSYPGARRDPAVGDAAYAHTPVTNFFHDYEKASATVIAGIWRSQFPPLPRVERAAHMCRRGVRPAAA